MPVSMVVYCAPADLSSRVEMDVSRSASEASPRRLICAWSAEAQVVQGVWMMMREESLLIEAWTRVEEADCS